MLRFLRAAVAALLLVVSHPSVAASLDGKVVAVHDGDTLTILLEETQVKVRLAEIDAPEQGQPWAAQSKQALVELAFGKDVRVVQQDTDRYGRMVARVKSGAIDLSAEMLRRGHAWVYRKYATDVTLYAIEDAARKAQRGLWALAAEQNIQPWDWPRQGRNTDVMPFMPPAGERSKCGAKRYCRQMSSCEEARHYLRNCGIASLDGDADGVPCESLCR